MGLVLQYLANGSPDPTLWMLSDESSTFFLCGVGRGVFTNHLQGRYDTANREYHFRNGDYEYVFNTVSQQLQMLYTDPETKKVEVVRRYDLDIDR